jgi:hypothetical protein
MVQQTLNIILLIVCTKRRETTNFIEQTATWHSLLCNLIKGFIETPWIKKNLILHLFVTIIFDHRDFCTTT